MKAIDIAGNKYERLTAIKPNGSKPGAGVNWLCKCDCGNEISATAKNLRNGNTKSCGCLGREITIARNKANATHGLTDSRTFVSWDAMKQRCLNSNHKSYSDYGGRGITVCTEWVNSFATFLKDMGERPDNTTLDRSDVNGNYEPSNCRWANLDTQNNNRRSSRLIEYNGKSQTITQWAREIGVGPKTLMYRLDSGWEIMEALTMKTGYGNSWLRGAR